MEKINILFVESNALLRQGLNSFLKTETKIASVKDYNCFDSIDKEAAEKAHLIIFDLEDKSDQQKIESFKQQYPFAKTVILSSEKHLIDNYLYAKQNQISAFLSKKDTLPAEMVEVVFDCFDLFNNRKLIIQPKLESRILSEVNKKEKYNFSTRELEILKLIQKGKTTKDISAILNISFRTVEVHRSRMIERIGCQNIIPVILQAIQHSYLSFDTGEKPALRVAN